MTTRDRIPAGRQTPKISLESPNSDLPTVDGFVIHPYIRVSGYMDLAANTALMSLFADATRLRLLALLDLEELTVTELTRITGLSQSRVSTHLGRLREAGAVLDRKVGVSTFYRLDPERMPDPVRRVWGVVRGHVQDALVEDDASRCADVVEARTGGKAWPDQVAGRMEHHYSPGRTWEALARGVIGLIDLGDVLDIGAGDGVLAQLLAPHAGSYTCVDSSPKVLAAAEARLSGHGNLSFHAADMHALPMEAGSFDQVLMFHVLTYAEQPVRAVGEAFRVLRPGGRLIAVTLDAHEHTSVSEAYDHVNQGFSAEALHDLLTDGGFDVPTCTVTARERRKPHFRVVTAFAARPAQAHVCAS